ncbi:MAG: lysophospholipase [Gammaproteobacteria bacterium]|nr:lysophospholipase [Gammaproteobacteria bacterium]
MVTPVEPVVPPPSALLSLTEAHRAVLEIFTLNLSRKHLRRIAPLGDGHPVMVLPGFMGDDGYNAAMRRFLGGLNYTVHGWGLGRNLGPRGGVLEGLRQRIHELYERHERPVSLVGHSLGGIFARELAREYPDKVRQVIALGSPFGRGRMTASVPARVFSALNPPADLPIDQDIIHTAPPVPFTAIYSKGDGIVNWRTTLQQDHHHRSQNIQVRGSHCGMTFNPVIWYLVAERLATDPDQWRPFQRVSWRNLFYPAADQYSSN